MNEQGVKVTVTDLATGETDEAIIWDDYILVTAGNRYQHSVVAHANGTHVITVKADKEKKDD